MSTRPQLKLGDYVRVTNLEGRFEEPWLRIGDEGVVVDVYEHETKGQIPTVRFFDNPERELALLLYRGDEVEVIDKTAVAS